MYVATHLSDVRLAFGTLRAMSTQTIRAVHAREVLDSRGNPTVEVEVALAGGASGRAIVPSGASTGAHEASELRDGGKRFAGKGVSKAVRNAKGPLAAAAVGLPADDLEALDRRARGAEGGEKRGPRGATPVLGRSLGGAPAAAAAAGKPLYRFLGERLGTKEWRLPV